MTDAGTESVPFVRAGWLRRCGENRGTHLASLRILSPQANRHVPASIVNGHFRLLDRDVRCALLLLPRAPREALEE